ncbi:NUDIX hydrolase [Microbacterium oleivorans]|uniref:NUDIX hydrolase n=1 Tax=Microbacterium oleivorans TaxID=273677 RepID=UPI0033E20C67
MKPLTLATIEAERRSPLTVAELRAAFAAGRTPRALLAVRLWTTWATGPFPLDEAPASEWALWFRLVGYLHNGVAAGMMRPTEGRRLYRGASPGMERGLSWTRFEGLAGRYAERVGGEVYSIDVEPSWVLARQQPRSTLDLRGDEWVVDLPAGVEPKPIRDRGPTSRTRSPHRRHAAGLLVHDGRRVLLQLRSERVEHGATWSIPGGALERGEHVVDGAIREAEEEAGIRWPDIELRGGVHVADLGHGRRFTTVLARPRGDTSGWPLVGPASWEVDRHEWVAIGDVLSRRLHPGFAAAWPSLRELIAAAALHSTARARA